MEIIRGIDKFDKSRYRQPIVIAIGTFDGVHRGHTAVIGRAVQRARRGKGTSVIVTFFPHPRRVAVPSAAPRLLTGIEHRLRLIAQLNPDVCLVVNFQKQFARLAAEKFLDMIVCQKLGAAAVVVGEKFHFGRDRQGTIDLLVNQGPRLGYSVDVVPVFAGCGKVISSSAIRRSISEGRFSQARCMLGRSYALAGTVVRGDGRGRGLGFPTANLDPHQELIPPAGVYAVRVRIGSRTHGGMCSIGTRETFLPGKRGPVIEVHIFNFRKSIYGKEIEVEFVRRIRGQKKFPTARRLAVQLQRDEKRSRHLLSLAG